MSREENRPSVYLDSCCFTDVVKHRMGHKLDPDPAKNKERLKYLWAYKKMLQAAIDGELVVFTSSLSRIECNSVDGDTSRKVQEEFDKVFEAANCVRLAQPTDRVQGIAKDLRWKHQINLQAMDATHVASAIVAGTKEFITTDGLAKSKSPIGNKDKLSKLGLRVIVATDSRELPDKYKSDELFV
jgi:predicted nucleic acid-binding protein